MNQGMALGPPLSVLLKVGLRHVIRTFAPVIHHFPGDPRARHPRLGERGGARADPTGDSGPCAPARGPRIAGLAPFLPGKRGAGQAR